MKTRRFTLLLVMLLAVFCGTTAMAQNPIRWRCSARMVSSTEGELTVRAIIDKGWHLYGMQMPKSGPKPTVINFSESTGVKFTTPLYSKTKPIKKFDQVFASKLQYWEKEAVFVRKFTLTGNKSDVLFKGSITFMAATTRPAWSPRPRTSHSS